MPAHSFRFLHAADLHLDSPLRGLARRGQAAGAFLNATRRALENLVTRAIDSRVAFLVIAGDIYDGDWRDYATGQFFVRQMGRLAREGIRVFLVRGNHDAVSVITRNLPQPANVHGFSVEKPETILLDDLKVALHGRGFEHRHVAENVVSGYPPAVPGHFNIGLLHTSLTGREGHDVYAPCSVDDLRRLGYDYWALGHIHQREVVHEAPAIVFPGNLQGRHARETGPKGATLVTVADGRLAEMEALVLDAVRFAHAEVDLSEVSEMAGLHAAASRAILGASEDAQGRPVALRVTLTGQTGLHDHLASHLEQVTEDLQALASHAGAEVLIEKVRIATAELRHPTDLPAIAGFDDILAAVAGDPGFRAEIARAIGDFRAKVPPQALALLGDGPDLDGIAASAIRIARETVAAGITDTDPEAAA